MNAFVFAFKYEPSDKAVSDTAICGLIAPKCEQRHCLTPVIHIYKLCQFYYKYIIYINAHIHNVYKYVFRQSFIY